MPYTINAKCPCCNKQANSIDELENEFGWRMMDNTKKIPQSYCKECRSADCKAGEPCKVK